MPPPDQWFSPQNKLLATFPVREYERLLPHFQSCLLAYKEIIQKSGVAIEYVYFLNDAIVSLLSVVEKGATIEVGIIGREGMVGAPVVLGSRFMPTQAVVQQPGSAVKLAVEALSLELKRSTSIQDILLPYTYVQLAEGNLSAACHRYHPAIERLSRWLLMVHDRSDSNNLKITHGFIAEMLGTRRATVTEAAHVLQKQGVISSSRGQISIMNRQGLEEMACSCYGIIRQRFAELRYA